MTRLFSQSNIFWRKEDTYSKPEHVDNQEILVRIMDTCDKEGKDPERYLKWADGYLVSLEFLAWGFRSLYFNFLMDFLLSFNAGNIQHHAGVYQHLIWYHRVCIQNN